MRSNTVFTIIFTIIIAAVLVGEVYVYTLNQERYSSDVRISDDGLGVEYCVTSGGAEQYSVLVLDNGNFDRIESYYIYYDANYGSKLEKVQVPVGAKELTQEYYISQLVKTLNNRGVHDIRILNAAELKDATEADISSSETSVKGLVVLSGALPDTVYKGGPGDLIFNWIGGGGSLYWAGNALGAYYSTSAGGIESVTGYEGLFHYGRSFSDSTDTELSDIGNGYRYSLSLMNNRIRYGMDPSGLTDGHLAVGYAKDGYCSTVLYKFGDGMICVLAGDYSSNQRHDLAQLIASGICYGTVAAGSASGNVKRGTASGTVDIGFVTGNNYTAYVYYGGYYTVYGKTTGWVMT